MEYVQLAKYSLETYIKSGELPVLPNSVNEEMLNKKAGVFVSLKKHGGLRGCIGTISPVQENIALEIMANAISAGINDYRFKPVTENELSDITYSVDVLLEPEPVYDKGELDVKEYGIIVSNGMKRGLLLPNLDGVDTVDEQIAIALSKAGISPDKDYKIERFKVVRHK